MNGTSDYRIMLRLQHYDVLPAQSFNVGVAGDRLVLPTTCLEQWFAKFDAKFKRDPDFLLSNLGDG